MLHKLAVALLGMAIVLVAGCSSPTNPTSQSTTTTTTDASQYRLVVDVTGSADNPSLAIVAPDGKSGGTEMLNSVIANSKSTGKDVDFVLQMPSADINRLNVGKYEIKFTWHKHPLKGCIGRDVWHAGFLIKNNVAKWVICDIHVAAWWENGPQVGIYVTRGEDWHTDAIFCKTTRGSFTAVRDAICEALKRVQVPSYYAYLMACAIAVILIPVLGLV